MIKLNHFLCCFHGCNYILVFVPLQKVFEYSHSVFLPSLLQVLHFYSRNLGVTSFLFHFLVFNSLINFGKIYIEFVAFFVWGPKKVRACVCSEGKKDILKLVYIFFPHERFLRKYFWLCYRL